MQPSQHDESYESLSSDDSLIATLTKQMSTMQQTIVALATSQRDINDKISRLNNMVISLGYRWGNRIDIASPNSLQKIIIGFQSVIEFIG